MSKHTMKAVCPFCERDPFHYVDNGIGMEAVAVDCCELGNLYFRGARAAPEEIDLSWEEFSEIGQRLLSTSTALREMREALESIRYHSENQDMSHLTFRIKARECADAAIEKATKP